MNAVKMWPFILLTYNNKLQPFPKKPKNISSLLAGGQMYESERERER